MISRLSISAIVLALSASTSALFGADGDLDGTFGAGGLSTTDFGQNDLALEAVQQADGKWVVAGDSTGVIAIARYLPTGVLDTNFGVAGGLRTSVGTFTNSADLALVDGGKILVAGTALVIGESNEFLLGRYLADGTLDPGFGTSGVAVEGVGTATNDRANAMAVGEDGKTVVVGTSNDGFTMARFDSSGILDASFGTGGWVQTQIGTSDDEAYDVALQVDGKIVVAGEAVIDGSRVLAIARYLPDGGLDTGFGEDGLLLGNFDVNIRSVAVQDDGRILVAGTAGGDFYLSRFLGNGDIDESLATGAVTINFGQDELCHAMTVQPDGKIVLAGASRLAGADSVAIARLLRNGSFDTSFASGVGGQVIPRPGSSISARAVALEAGSRILLAGADGAVGSLDFALLRLQNSLEIGPARMQAISADSERVVLDWLPFGDGQNYTVERSTGLGAWLPTEFSINDGKTLAVLPRSAEEASAYRVRSP